MRLKEKALACVELLETEYPEADCSLDEREPYKLLISLRLAAQCTDARVNIVTPILFERFPTLLDIANADVSEVEQIVKPCGFFRIKARDIVACAKMLIAEYDGVVPDTIEQLIKLPGVGRKSANLIVGDVYGKPSVVADTHCIRITGLLGLVDSKDPTKVEMQLRKILPLPRAGQFCHALVHHGRAVCIARRPNCDICVMKHLCKFFLNGKKTVKAKK